MNHSYSRITLIVIVLFGLVGCGKSANNSADTPAVKGKTPSKEQPLVYNSKERTISVYATVNGTYTRQPTRHGMNFREGSIGDKSLFISYANPLDFHDALLELNAKRGEFAERFVRGGTRMEVSVTWEGADKDYALSEVINDSTGTELDIRYGGKVAKSARKFTGCMMCLDSCNVGVTSNSSHPKKIIEDPDADVSLRGDPDVLPEDGTPVIVTLALGDR